MEKIKRYTCGAGDGMFEEGTGNWVEYSEYQKLKKEMQQLLQQTPCTTHLPVWAVELLTEIRFRVLVDLDQDGEPHSSMAELMAMWDKVNDALHLNTIGQLR